MTSTFDPTWFETHCYDCGQPDDEPHKVGCELAPPGGQWVYCRNFPGCLPETEPFLGSKAEVVQAVRDDLLTLADEALTSVPPDTDTSEAAAFLAERLQHLPDETAWYEEVDGQVWSLEQR